MNFALQAPSGLLWLLPLGGAIVALYLLRMRRRDVRVPASFLWPERTEEIRANALFQKLRFSWLLVLQLLALAALIFAVARPQTKQFGLTGEVTVLVVDASASMGATDVQPTRFDEARALAREAINSAKPGDRIALIEAGPVPRVIFPLGNDPQRQLAALGSMERSDAEADTGEALRLAAALVGSLEGARIVLLSDGVFPKIENFARGKAAFVYKSIGKGDKNLSIQALGVSETAQGPAAFVSVQNHSLSPVNGVITLYADGSAIDSTKISLKYTSKWGRVVPVPAGAKVLEAKLEAGDLLKADNYAVALTNPAASLRVLLITPGDIFLERALALDPRVTLDRAPSVPANMKGTGPGAYDVVVFDGVPQEPVKASGVLVFGLAGVGSPVKREGTLKAPVFLVSEPHPLMDAVDLRGVFIDQGEKVSAVGSAKVVATSSGGPLVVVSERRGRQVYVAFEPLKSDFPLQPSFPIFVANALTYLAGQAATDTLAVRAAAPFSLNGVANATLTGQGVSKSLVGQGGSLAIREIQQVGKYALATGGRKIDVFATMQSAEESNLAPRPELDLGGGIVKSTQTPARFADFWRPLILLCLAVLGAEWWLFARKS
ncbi:MAG: vWA domain-containing protein [Fimbriimonas sp.]